MTEARMSEARMVIRSTSEQLAVLPFPFSDGQVTDRPELTLHQTVLRSDPFSLPCERNEVWASSCHSCA